LGEGLLEELAGAADARVLEFHGQGRGFRLWLRRFGRGGFGGQRRGCRGG
jgi:hypothetical protein